jgi:hypothetical protein
MFEYSSTCLSFDVWTKNFFCYELDDAWFYLCSALHLIEHFYLIMNSTLPSTSNLYCFLLTTLLPLLTNMYKRLDLRLKVEL